MSVCGGDALDRVVVVPGPPGKDGKDGVVDPSALTELAEPGDDTGVVVVDSGEVKFSRWSAFKARIAQWLSSGPEAVSANTQTDLSDVPEVRSVRLKAGSTPYRSLAVLDHRAENPGGVPYNGLAFRIGYEGSGANEADSLVQMRTRKGGFVLFVDSHDGAAPVNIVLAARNGNAYVSSGAMPPVSSAAVPANQIATGSNVLELRNKTLVSPTFTGNVLLTLPKFVNSSGENLLILSRRGLGAQVNTPITQSNIAGEPVAFGAADESGDRDVDVFLAPKGEGVVTARVGVNNPSGFAQIAPVAVKVPVPATATAAGNEGQYATNATHLFVCVADNSWKRVAWDTW